MADANKLKNHILRLKENYMKKTLATVVLAYNGGRGVVRELLEEVLELDFIEILYSN